MNNQRARIDFHENMPFIYDKFNAIVRALPHDQHTLSETQVRTEKRLSDLHTQFKFMAGHATNDQLTQLFSLFEDGKGSLPALVAGINLFHKMFQQMEGHVPKIEFDDLISTVAKVLDLDQGQIVKLFDLLDNDIPPLILAALVGRIDILKAKRSNQ